MSNGRKGYHGASGGRSRTGGGGSGGYGWERDQEPLGPIPSPYNFVPLSDRVFFPDWVDRVSMDIPFSDGLCGWLDVEVTAETPLYIRNGGEHAHRVQERNQNRAYQDFFRVLPETGEYAIPGTSFKGMLRSVLEIASFGKMIRTDNNRFSVRDLQNTNLYTHWMTTQTSPHSPKVCAGWLRMNEGNAWVIMPCSVARVEVNDLIAYHPGRPALGAKQSAPEKYRQWGSQKSLDVSFQLHPQGVWNHNCTSACRHKPRNLQLKYHKVSQLGSGPYHGRIVFTGQPSAYNGQRHVKHLEFVFYERVAQELEVEERVARDFRFVHSTADGAKNPEWAFWYSKLKAGQEVPVFYLMTNERVESLGLAMMYRLPYKHSIHDAIRHTSSNHLEVHRLDLAETIFGRVEGDDALRGRVQVETLLAAGNPQTAELQTTVLGGPKPSFYPTYIEQEADPKDPSKLRGEHYNTFMDDGCRIRGWKRYPVIRGHQPRKLPPLPVSKNQEANLDVATVFRPLPAGSQFRGRIHFHNLRPVELGALVWCLEWGGNAALRHSIGMAKAYGYGKVAVRIREAEILSMAGQAPARDACRESFEALMREQVPDWEQSDEIRSLLAMANPDHAAPHDLAYPILDMKTNEFRDYKKQDRILPPILERGLKRSQQSREGASARPAPAPAVRPAVTSAVVVFLHGLKGKKFSQSDIKSRGKQIESLTPEQYEQIRTLLAKRPEVTKYVDPYKELLAGLEKKIRAPSSKEKQP